jgi:replicative DNA helicase
MSATISATPGAGPVYPFDAELQTEIAALCMWDHDFLRRTDGLIEPEYFGCDVEAGFIRLAIDFYAKHREAPSKAAWMQIIRDGYATKPTAWREDLKGEVVDKLAATSRMDVRSRAFLLDHVAEFAKQQALLNGLIIAADAVGKQSDPKRFEKIESILTKAFKVGLQEGDEDYDYFEKIEERTQERLDIAGGGKPKTGVTTGVAELDGLLLHGGWGRREMSLFMGAMKSSKSFNLLSAAAAAVEAGYNVLFVTLENSAAIQAQRIDAYFSDIGMSNHLSSAHTVAGKVRAVGARTSIGKLKIREFPTGVFKPRDLERLLEDYAAKGLMFDLIVVDYLDIMAPDVAAESEREASKQIYTRCRGIIGTYRGPRGHAALLSATQTNREGAKAATAVGTHVAEDINKVRIADLVISINRTDDEKAQSKARLHIALARNQRDSVTIFVKQDLDKGRAVSAVESVE